MKYYLLENQLTVEQRAINRQLEISFDHIVEYLKRLSESLDIEEFRQVFELDHRDNPEVQATISECITPYFLISLGADDTGYFNMAYSVDYRAKEILGDCALNDLMRAIYRFTTLEYKDIVIEHRVFIHSLAFDVLPVFQNLQEG